MSEELPSDPDLGAWRRITSARRRAVLALWSIAALMVPIGVLPKDAIMRKVLALLGLLAMIAVVGLLSRVRCPHCGGRYFLRGQRRRPRACGQCGAVPGTLKTPRH